MTSDPYHPGRMVVSPYPAWSNPLAFKKRAGRNRGPHKHPSPETPAGREHAPTVRARSEIPSNFPTASVVTPGQTQIQMTRTQARPRGGGWTMWLMTSRGATLAAMTQMPFVPFSAAFRTIFTPFSSPFTLYAGGKTTAGCYPMFACV